MAATFTYRASGAGSIHAEKVPGSFLDAIIEMKADNSYPANGYPFGVTQLNNLSGGAYSTIESVEVVSPCMVNSSGVPQPFVPVFDKTNNTVRILSNATDAELATSNAGANNLVASLRVRFN